MSRRASKSASKGGFDIHWRELEEKVSQHRDREVAIENVFLRFDFVSEFRNENKKKIK